MPLHPGLVHYPIALIVQSMVFQALYLIFKQTWLTKAALITWAIALAGAIAAAITGTTQAEAVLLLGSVDELLALHERLANLTIFISLGGLLYSFIGFQRNRLNPWITFAFLLLLSGMVLVTGHFGGQLVYLHGTGITPQ
jgi:uncharacterized membrane protein